MCSIARLTMSEFISNTVSAGDHTAAKAIVDQDHEVMCTKKVTWNLS